ncbi:hypothetical protein ACJRO7_001376 [Eucalyptus globulus]|uniref:Calcineurin-like phosphoesterase domain-containing protein n=1 Tax=Eucalyptus globulus TaxID=34317 RepID=A0ABD3LWE8_EUCGL
MALTQTVICVGDVHGHFTELCAPWANLEFCTALVIFLGDYCDHGLVTRQVSLPASMTSPLPPPSAPSLATPETIREGWNIGEGCKNMHLRARRWAGKIKARFNKAEGTVFFFFFFEERDWDGDLNKKFLFCRVAAPTCGRQGSPAAVQMLKSLQAKDARIAKILAILHIQGLQLIIDKGDGSPDKPVTAVVLPSLKIIRNTDVLSIE